MTNTSNNPLQKYFRQPAIYLRLPSQGQYYPDGALNMPVNQELPVYPMTALDEITYRTADGLFNGSSVVDVIKSCVPNIVDPWQMPSVDLDTVLIAIRIASYGHEMEFNTKCPECESENDFALDLRTVLEKISMPNYQETLNIGDLVIYFKPLTYFEANQNSMDQFEDTKILQTIPDADMPEQQKLDILHGALIKLGEMTVKALTQCISLIKAGDDVVTDKEHISDFIRNADKKVYDAIRARVEKYRDASTLQPVQAQCEQCEKIYTTPFTMDVANFFGSSS